MTATLPGERLALRIGELVPGAIEAVIHDDVYIVPALIGQVCSRIREDEELDFAMLRSLDAVDFVDHFELRYALLSIARNHQATLKIRLWGRDDIVALSVTFVWEGANLQERELYDLFGVEFEGHPNMKRVLLWEGFPGHPLRKDFP